MSHPQWTVTEIGILVDSCAAHETLEQIQQKIPRRSLQSIRREIKTAGCVLAGEISAAIALRAYSAREPLLKRAPHYTPPKTPVAKIVGTDDDMERHRRGRDQDQAFQAAMLDAVKRGRENASPGVVKTSGTDAPRTAAASSFI